MLCNVSPGATTCMPVVGANAVRGAPTGMPGTVEAIRVVGGTEAAAEGERRGITRWSPGCTMAGLVMLLACMMAETGTPCWREIMSKVSPGAIVIGVPPSQVQAGGGGAAGTEPVISVLPG